MIADKYCGYAISSRPITGVTRMRVLPNHQKAPGSPRNLPFAPRIEVAKASRPLTNEISTAINPRLKQPRTSTGVNATPKKRAGRMAGPKR